MNILVLLVGIGAAVDAALAVLDVWGPPVAALTAGALVRITRRSSLRTPVRTGARTTVRTGVRARATRASRTRPACTDIRPDTSADTSGHDNGGS